MDMVREGRLVEAMVQAADTLAEDFDIVGFLQDFAGNCVRLLDVDAAGLILADRNGMPHTIAASDERTRQLELLELQSACGPCVDVLRTGEQVVSADVRADRERWPRFAEAAAAAGFRSVHALPLGLRATVLGAVNLFRPEPGPLGGVDAHIGRALADVAAIGIFAQRSIQQTGLVVARLQRTLDNRVAVEQAKGVLAERHGITADEAFELLRDVADTRGVSLADLAAQVAEGATIAYRRGPAS
jgi:hypothetical protein